MAPEHDIIVIGSGSAGQTVATTCAEAGKRVAVIDSREPGGTCAQRGCVPKKVLFGAAGIVRGARLLSGHGVTGNARVDWPALVAFKRTFTDPVPDKVAESLRDAGATLVRGRARFVSEDALDVDGARMRAPHIVIATGSAPRPLGIPGEEHITTSEAFFEIDALPRRIAFIGGGYVSCELAHIARAAGSEVTILHRGERILHGFDADLVDVLTESMREDGIGVKLGCEVSRIEKTSASLVLHGKDGARVEADLVVHGAGRTPQLDDLDLDKAGIERTRRGVRVDEHLRSVGNPRVFAAGDCADAGAEPLTPVATRHGEIVAHNLLHAQKRRFEPRAVASVAFTLPPLARVGLGEDEARDAGVAVDVHHQQTSGWFSAKHLQEPASAHKILVARDGGHVVGAHLLGPRADEVVNLFTLAMRHKLPFDEVKDALYVFPTASYDLTSMG